MTRKRKSNPPATIPPDSQPVMSERRSVSIAEMHVGPIPPARDLVLIEEKIPGAAIRIIEMAEREQKRQAKRDEILLKSNEQDRASNRFCAERSQIFSFIFAFLYIGFLFCLAFLGLEKPLKYAIVSGLVIGLPAVIHSFAIGFRRHPKQERE